MNTECPLCETPQPFPRFVRNVPDRPWREAVIKCRVCPWEKVLGPTTNAIESARRYRAGWARRAESERRRHGIISASTDRGAQRARENHVNLVRELRHTIQSHEQTAN